MPDSSKVFAWKPKFVLGLCGNSADVNQLTGILLADIPARCFKQVDELEQLKQILGVQKLKVQVDTRVSCLCKGCD
jgi:hypothetical protein